MRPLFVVLCENGTNRDENMIRGLLRPRALRVIPCLGPSLDDKAARVLERVAKAAGEAELVLVVHRDADDEAVTQRRQEIDDWVRENALSQHFTRLVKCVPVPCSERWLCFGAGLRADAKSTRNSCAPWKKRWERERAPEWKRLEAALQHLKEHGRSLPDFALFAAELG